MRRSRSSNGGVEAGNEEKVEAVRCGTIMGVSHVEKERSFAKSVEWSKFLR